MDKHKVTHTRNLWDYLKELFRIFKDAGSNPDGLIVGFTLLSVFFMPISLSGTTLFLFLAGVSWLMVAFRRKQPVLFPPFFVYLFAFGFFSIVSIFFSLDPPASLKLLKKLPLVFMPLLFYNVINNRVDRAKHIYALYAGLLLNSTYGFIMYFAGRQHRLSGFIGHYMTTAAILMMVVIILLAGLLSFGFKRFGFCRFCLLFFFFFALMFTLTRNAWVGTAVAFGILFVVIKPRLVPLMLVLLFIAFLILPFSVQQRIASTFDLQDSTIQDRVKMIRTGVNIIRDYPLWGVGPEMVPRVYDEYKASKDDIKRPHLHNNILQIAAERGLVTLAAWLAFLCSVVFYSTRLYRQVLKGPDEMRQDAYLYIACAVIVFSIITAGLFEYNYGDTEVETLFFFFVAIPFVLHKDQFHRRRKVVRG